MAVRKLVIVIMVVALMIALQVFPVQAEWFDKGKAAYSKYDGKWQKAAINIVPGKIEVFDRDAKALVASFTDGDIKHGITSRHRIREAVMFAIAGAGVVALGAMQAEEEKGELLVRDGDLLVREGIDSKQAGIMLGVVCAAAAIVGLTKAKEPYAEITDRKHRLLLRVDKDDLARFQLLLKF